MDNKALIHIIDDDEKHCEMMNDILSYFGYRCIRSLDGTTGIKNTQQHLPDLIFLDVQLPDITGFETCKLIKKDKNCSHIPIIITTGKYMEKAEKEKGYRLGVKEFVPKPLEISNLKEKLALWLEKTSLK